MAGFAYGASAVAALWPENVQQKIGFSAGIFPEKSGFLRFGGEKLLRWDKCGPDARYSDVSLGEVRR
jgi:hypothetical protein